jgi:Fur family ferric uptake transcriptional regulator
MASHETSVRDRLKAAGLRITAPRVAVLEWLAVHPDTTADQVAEGVRPVLGSLSAQAVQDALGACARAELVRRVEAAGHPARFEARLGNGRHHLVCRSCGRAQEVDCVPAPAPCLEPGDVSGFVVEAAEVVFRGLCPACDKREED